MSLLEAALIVVTFESSPELENFLSSLRDSEPQASELPVVVVDNASSDRERTAAIAKNYGAELLALGKNVGYGQAVNRAEALLSPQTRFLLVSNPDLQVRAGALSKMLAEMEADPALAAVGPRILEPGGETYPSARRLPSLGEGIGHALLSRLWPGNPWSRSYRQSRQLGRRHCDWLSGAFLLLRRSSFNTVGGFSSEFFMYFEDVDLGWRLGQAGGRSLYQPEAVVEHLGGRSTAKAKPEMVAAHHRSAYVFLRKRYPNWYFLPLRLLLRGGLAVRCRLQVRAAKKQASD